MKTHCQVLTIVHNLLAVRLIHYNCLKVPFFCLTMMRFSLFLEVCNTLVLCLACFVYFRMTYFYSAVTFDSLDIGKYFLHSNVQTKNHMCQCNNNKKD